MANQQKIIAQAEALVRRLLTEKFNQKVSKETLHAIAEKVARSVSTKGTRPAA